MLSTKYHIFSGLLTLVVSLLRVLLETQAQRCCCCPPLLATACPFSGEAALRSWLRGSVELHVAWGIFFFFSFPATIKKINLIRNSLFLLLRNCV